MASEKDLYLLEAVPYFAKLIELADTNRLSPAYGCFDRAYWHYRTADFPSAMYQESVLPLALFYSVKSPLNPYAGKERIKEIAAAGIDFSARSAHKDASGDDYFPYERAAGATGFALYACTEAYLRLGLKNARFEEFFRRRARYLVHEGMRESGTLSNHKALFILASYNAFLITGDESLRKASGDALKTLLRLQRPEGWFPEYEGCDPGYLTFTIDFLAKYYQKSQDSAVLGPLSKAVRFLDTLVHPDGSLGGEYGSRNTFHFMPHGFEILANHVPEARRIADKFLESLALRARSYIDDDRIFIHYVYNFIQAYEDYTAYKPEDSASSLPQGIIVHKEAGIAVSRAEDRFAVCGLKKGGVFKVFQGSELKFSFASFTGKSSSGKTFISQAQRDSKWELKEDVLICEGACFLHKPLLFTPFKFWLFRSFLIFAGRFLPPNFVRRLLQKKAITNKNKEFPLRFRMQLDLAQMKEWVIRFYYADRSEKIESLWASSDSTFIYIATSQPFQKGKMLPWVDLSSILEDLNRSGEAVYRHKIL